MSDLSPTKIMARHKPDEDGWCDYCGGPYDAPCDAYRLAEEVATLRERLARVEACAEAYGYERIPLALDDRAYPSPFAESNIRHPEGASVAHQIPRGAERSQQIATDPDRSQLDGPSETRSD